MLKIDWCTHKAAKYACLNWHYSKCLPVGKLVKVGAWEDNKYIGCVIFGRGANNNLCKAFKLNQTEVCELARVALRKHNTPVSRIIKIAISMLKKSNAGLKLIVSYADSGQGHYGGIYQAGNWVYDISSVATSTVINGKKMHNKSVYSKYGFNGLQKLKDAGIKAHHVKDSPKHRYLFPLDKQTRKQILPLSQPYPKRTTKANSDDQLECGGAIPTCSLQTKEVSA